MEAYISLVNDLLNTHHANISNRANEIMKTLTIFASLFIPLTFVAGIYGMNFQFIPELQWQWGYLFFWIVIITIVVSFFIYFRRVIRFPRGRKILFITTKEPFINRPLALPCTP